MMQNPAMTGSPGGGGGGGIGASPTGSIQNPMTSSPGGANPGMGGLPQSPTAMTNPWAQMLRGGQGGMMSSGMPQGGLAAGAPAHGSNPWQPGNISGGISPMTQGSLQGMFGVPASTLSRWSSPQAGATA